MTRTDCRGDPIPEGFHEFAFDVKLFAVVRVVAPNIDIARAAVPSASSPDPQSRFTVAPGTSTGRPASKRAMRATLRLSSPAWLAQP